MRFSIKLKDIVEDEKTGALVRAVDLLLPARSVPLYMKIPRYEINRFSSISSIAISINEAYIRLNYEKINKINRDNREKHRFINSYLGPKLRKDKVNVPIVDIEVDKEPSEKEMEQISQFVVDVVYSHPKTTLFVPPKITLPDGVDVSEKYNTFQVLLETLSRTLETYQGSVKVCYFVPDYITRTVLPKLIEYYVSNFGEDALVILDVNGERFSAHPYSDVSLIHREMSRNDIETYAIYLFSHKGRMRSGREVPSEDLLALLNGVNLVSPNHRVIRLPRAVVETRPNKIFNEGDFLFYPEDKAPNAKEFQNFCALGKRKDKDKMLEIFNDIKINTSAISLFKEPAETLSALKRPEFCNVLKSIAKKRQNIIQQKSLDLFF
jgi:hypothetical protein